MSEDRALRLEEDESTVLPKELSRTMKENISQPTLSSDIVPTAGPTQPPSTRTPKRERGGASTGNGIADGTLTISVILMVIFFFVYSPRIFRRCFPRYVEQRSRRAVRMAAVRAAEEEAIRTILEGNLTGRSVHETRVHGVALEDRRDFVRNVLVTKKVISLTNNSTETGQKTRHIVLPKRASLSDTPSSGEINGNLSNDSPELSGTEAACAICMEDYEEGDEICWSHNERCSHVFHRECIMEWLVRHDDCPCCRLNFLSLNDDSENIIAQHDEAGGVSENNNGSNTRNNSTRIVNPASHVPPLADDSSEEDTSAFHRGMSMFHQLSRETGRHDDGSSGRGVEMATIITGDGVSDNPGNARVTNEVNADNSETEMRNEEVVRPPDQT